jgi:hypothetical protein
MTREAAVGTALTVWGSDAKVRPDSGAAAVSSTSWSG